MTKITLDFTGVSDGFTPLPEGKYLARVDDIKPGISKKGNPKFDITFKITAPNNGKGRLAWLTLTNTEEAKWKIKETLVGFGYPPEALKGKVDIDWADILGRECTITIKHREHEGKIQMDITKVEAAVDPETLVEASATKPKGGWSDII